MFAAFGECAEWPAKEPASQRAKRACCVNKYAAPNRANVAKHVCFMSKRAAAAAAEQALQSISGPCVAPSPWPRGRPEAAAAARAQLNRAPGLYRAPPLDCALAGCSASAAAAAAAQGPRDDRRLRRLVVNRPTRREQCKWRPAREKKSLLFFFVFVFSSLIAAKKKRPTGRPADRPAEST